MIRPAPWALPLLLAVLPGFASTGASAADVHGHSDVTVPAAPGSQSPRLSQGPDGIVVLSWLEPAGEAWALRYARWQDGAWQQPATVVTGDDWFVNWADLPAVTPLRDGFWVAHWLVRRAAGGYAYDIRAAVSTDAGQSFGAPLPVHRDATDTEHGFVSLFPQAGGAGLVWLDGRRTAGGDGMTLRTATLTPAAELVDERELDDVVCDCCQTDVTVTPAGPLVVYRDRADAEVRDIYTVSQLDGEWQPGSPVSKDGWIIDGCPVNGPAVASAADEVVVAWFTAAGGRPRVRLARAAGSGSPFATPVDVFVDDTLGRVGLALPDDRSAVVSALRRTTGGGAALTLARVAQDGNVGPPYTLADHLSAFSVPQLVHTGGRLLVVWPSPGDGGVRGLRSALLPAALLE